MRSAALLLWCLAPVLAEEPPRVPPAEPVPDAKAKEAIDAFRKEPEGADPDLRCKAVERLSKAGSPLVADVLLDLALKDPSIPVRTEAFRGLLRQSAAAKAAGPKVARWVADSAAETRKARAKGEYGILLDKKTGDADLKSEEGKAALKAKREGGKLLAGALRLLDALEVREKDTAEALRTCLEDADDDVVVLSLGMLGRWKQWTALPEVQALFDLYPDEQGWETGTASVDTGKGGAEDQEAAKRRWTAKFGDPDRARARPRVVKGIRKALLDITGTAIADPKALLEFRKRPEVRKKEKAR